MKKTCILCSMVLLLASVGFFSACANKKTTFRLEDIPQGSKKIAVSEYRERVESAYIGQLVGVSYGRPVEFKSKQYMEERDLPTWRGGLLYEGYNQDDVYLSVTAVQALHDFGIDATSRTLAVEMYNKDFEFWGGSNETLRRWAPPFSGYPATEGAPKGNLPDSCSYLCGISFAGLLSPAMPAQSNDLAQGNAGTNGANVLYRE